MYFIRITAYPNFAAQTAMRYTLEEATALRDELLKLGYFNAKIVETKKQSKNKIK